MNAPGFLHSHWQEILKSFFYFSYSDRDVWIFYCSFNLHFSMATDIEHLFVHLLVICMACLVMCQSVFCPFPGCFLLLSFKSSRYTPDILYMKIYIDFIYKVFVRYVMCKYFPPNMWITRFTPESHQNHQIHHQHL